ncbi:hypothetical protein MTO96_023443 [Rhipicephalus appendiculatus]
MDRDRFHRAARDGYLDLLREATRKGLQRSRRRRDDAHYLVGLLRTPRRAAPARRKRGFFETTFETMVEPGWSSLEDVYFLTCSNRENVYIPILDKTCRLVGNSTEV